MRISKDYRAIGVLIDDEIIWFWIGSHSEYDKLKKPLGVWHIRSRMKEKDLKIKPVQEMSSVIASLVSYPYGTSSDTLSCSSHRDAVTGWALTS